jgi:nucleoside-diphosphate-sugar epimerase
VLPVPLVANWCLCYWRTDGRSPGRRDPPLAETHPTYGGTVIGVKRLENQVVEAPLDGIVLRYGLLYGPGTGFDAPIAPGSVHVAAAAKAAELAVTHATPGIYNVAEDDGSVVTERARNILAWDAHWRA